MTPPLRQAGEPSPILANTHDDADLRPAIAFDPAVAGPPVELGDAERAAACPDEQMPALSRLTGWIRPICVGALMAIPTAGTACVGMVAFFSERRAMSMVKASTAFLAGIPGDVVLLIGALATGYGFAKTVERIKGSVS